MHWNLRLHRDPMPIFRNGNSPRADWRDEGNFIAMANYPLPPVLSFLIIHIDVIQVDSNRTAREDLGRDAGILILEMLYKVAERHGCR